MPDGTQNHHFATVEGRASRAFVREVLEAIDVFCDQAFKDAYRAARLGPRLFEPT